MSDKPEQSNLHQLAVYSTRMAEGDYDAVYEYFDENFMSHVTERVNPDEAGKDIRGREKEFWESAKRAFPDMQFDVNLVLESGDFIISNWTLTGTHTGEAYYDVPPSNEKITINGTAILRFENGKVVEHWGGPHCMNGVGLTNGAS
jgi:predicted ester cyclase